eukprot:gnl/TRDRNA2_/TRDRNA2_68603_c0_seq1.p1 gnl/TRDRNA2_/TRDRNA2_68603_c0~~gnl/TRDRNA2_/TRDRNA2_68603_c0_seq1.p1  ORF type:complete len:624 (+),score=69.24 gnl/TRDRNA2_/TRDRNA2_68603_c0_seq1:30-1901(+)
MCIVGSSCRHCLLTVSLLFGTSVAAQAVECKSFDPRNFGPSRTACVGGQCGPEHQQCGPAPVDAPQFHITDASCQLNDPNAPFFDPVHGMYHVFYQDHLAIASGTGPVWGHVVSRDLVSWARLPVALWNDHKYDENFVWSGSATVVDGKPVLLYPGGTKDGIMIAAAQPKDHSDPLYTEWTKDSWTLTNPLLELTERDPSTAWRTKEGEWRFITYTSKIYGSMDFQHWYDSGDADLPVGECPSFFELPPLYPGTQTPDSVSELPTHVIKYSDMCLRRDIMDVGFWEDGPPGTAGEWTAYPGQSSDGPNVIDAGNFYASKDFADPVKGRRLNIGWVVIPPDTGNSALSLTRQITWHPVLRQLVHSPAEELVALRGDVLLSQTGISLREKDSVWLGDWPRGVGNQAEIVIKLARPNSSTVFGIDVMAGSVDSARALNSSTRIFLDYQVGLDTAQVGVTSGTSPWSIQETGHRSTLKLLPEDTEIEIRVFIDHTFVEAYWMDGRVAISSALLGSSPTVFGMRLFNVEQAVFVSDLHVWWMKSIWKSPEQVLQTPRLDGAGMSPNPLLQDIWRELGISDNQAVLMRVLCVALCSLLMGRLASFVVLQFGEKSKIEEPLLAEEWHFAP